MKNCSLIRFALVVPALVVITPDLLTAAVSFNDARLERAVLVELGRTSGTVSEAELAVLTHLDAPFHGIIDLSGLEGANSLIRLNLFGNAVTDLTPLATVNSLEDLDLGANRISEVGPLAELTSLSWLRLDLNPLENLDPLSGLTALQQLFIDGTGVISLNFLASMNQLVRLDAANNSIADASILGVAAPLLQELDLSGNRLTTATFLNDLPHLATVDLQDNFLVEIDWPSGFRTAPVSPDQWTHVALVLQGGELIQPDSLKVYFEGSLLGTAQGSQLWSHGADTGIGAMLNQTRFPDSQPDGEGYYFDGSLDELRIYHRALSASEIADLASGTGPSDSAVYWSFDGDALDLDGSNHGILIGDAAFGNGIVGQALVLDGSGDAVSVPDSAHINLRTATAVTVSLFFKAADPGGSRQILYEQGGRTRGLNLYLENGFFIAGAWNDIPDESGWAGDWIGQPTALTLTRLNVSGNQLETLPTIAAGCIPDWDISHNRLFDIDSLLAVSGPGTLRLEGNFFDPQTVPAVPTLTSVGVDVLGDAPSSYINYATWRGIHFQPADETNELISGPSSDPDCDGFINLFECAFGGDPLVPDSRSIGPVQSLANDAVMIFRYRDRCPEITLQVQASASLESGSWSPPPQVPFRDPLSGGWRLETPVPANNPLFLRLQANP
jgi:Leucine-rich repeat (LRR) protein